MITVDKYGPWALITGASSGIGEQFARQLAALGFNLVITARRKEYLDKIKAELESAHRIEVVSVVADIAKEQGCQIILDSVKSLDIGLLISNAGFGYKGEFCQQPVDELLAMLQVNMITPMLLAHGLLPRLKQRSSSGIIFTGSIEGEVGFPHSTAYAASKAFIHSLGGGLWEEVRSAHVDVLVLSPGSTDTHAPIAQGISRDQLVGIMSPQEVAKAALNALGKTPLLIPGLHNRMFIGFLRLLPRSWALRLAGMGLERAILNSRKASGVASLD